MKKILEPVNEQEEQGLVAMKALNQKFLEKDQGSLAVREFLQKAGNDDVFLLRNLRGRKYRPKHAWETVKRYAEIRFDKYPEVFSVTFLDQVIPLIENNIFGILKTRDSKGRIVCYFNASKWDTDKYSIENLLAAAVFLVERVLSSEDAVSNQFIFIQECGAMEMKHFKQYTLFEMTRVINIFWHAFPIQLKGAYFVNVPYIFSVVYRIIRPFFPKKLKERVLFTYTGDKFDALHDRISPEILPKLLGGHLKDQEAVDLSMLRLA